jgi:DNA-binding transcriptional LysR family regulator
LTTRWVTLASPAFIARYGAPRAPAELGELNCLRFLLPNGRPRDFSFQMPDSAEPKQLAVTGNLLIDHGEYLLEAALAGMGVAQVLDFMALEHLKNGALSELLSDFSAAGPAIYSVSAPPRHRSANVRAFNAFLGEVFGMREARKRSER